MRDITNERARAKFADLDKNTPITAFFKDLDNSLIINLTAMNSSFDIAPKMVLKLEVHLLISSLLVTSTPTS